MVRTANPEKGATRAACVRARQLNAYHHMLGEGVVEDVAPPLVNSRSKNYLTMSLEEVAQDRLAWGSDK